MMTGASSPLCRSCSSHHLPTPDHPRHALTGIKGWQIPKALLAAASRPPQPTGHRPHEQARLPHLPTQHVLRPAYEDTQTYLLTRCWRPEGHAIMLAETGVICGTMRALLQAISQVPKGWPLSPTSRASRTSSSASSAHHRASRAGLWRQSPVARSRNGLGQALARMALRSAARPCGDLLALRRSVLAWRRHVDTLMPGYAHAAGAARHLAHYLGGVLRFWLGPEAVAPPRQRQQSPLETAAHRDRLPD